MFLFLYLYISTIYLSIIHVYRLVVIMTLHPRVFFIIQAPVVILIDLVQRA